MVAEPQMFRDPEGAGASRQPMSCEIDPHLRLGPVQLAVSNLDRSCAYYEQLIGMSLLDRQDQSARFGAGDRPLLELVEVPGARPMPTAAGLFHVAYLLHDRDSLAAWLRHAISERISLEGASDHFVSEALYLRDPDGHGIEIYADRPRDQWEGHVAATMNSTQLDLDSLLALVEEAPPGYGGLPAATTVGHVHLQVADIVSTRSFYCDVLGFGLMAEIQGAAAFFGAGGYHHHLAANTWHSAGRPPAPDDSAALRHLTVLLSSDQALGDVRMRLDHHGVPVREVDNGLMVDDPAGNTLLLVVDPDTPSV